MMVRTLSKLMILSVVMLLLTITLLAQTQGTIKICKGVPIPDGYTIIEETPSSDCPKGAYLIKRTEVSSPNQPAAQLTEAQMKEARELLLLVDAMEIRLKRAWNQDNDFGVTTNEDHSYTKGAMNAAESIASRLDKLPNGDYKLYLMAAAIAYVDVGRIRMAAGEDDGEDFQRNIVKNYKLENTEPHLWAWRVWEIARAARNVAAKQLGLPERKYDDKE
jgi:hypothetical protein